MSKRKRALAVVAVALFATAGCQTPRGSTPYVVNDDRTITLTELAARLGLRITEQAPSFIILKDDANTVIIYTNDGGRYFVNGDPAGRVGATKTVAGDTRVSERLASEIKPLLGAAPAFARPIVRPSRGTHVMIDPGHGGRDPGAIGVTGVYEKSINLAVAGRVATELRRRGYTVTMTRQDDRYPELEERAALANQLGVDLFVSIHCDSIPDSDAEGFTVYIAEAASSEAQEAARTIANAMETTGANDRGVRRENYRVLVRTRCPAVLIELGYISSRREVAKLQSGAYQNRLATAIATGIADYLR